MINQSFLCISDINIMGKTIRINAIIIDFKISNSLTLPEIIEGKEI